MDDALTQSSHSARLTLDILLRLAEDAHVLEDHGADVEAQREGVTANHAVMTDPLIVQRGLRRENRHHQRFCCLLTTPINNQRHAHATIRSGVDEARRRSTDVLTDVRAQQVRDVPVIHDDLSDLAANLFLLVRHVRVRAVHLALHVHLLRQGTKRTIDPSLE